jgi:hypothetical protein
MARANQQLLSGDAIWAQISAALKAKHPARIAVPFIGYGASRWLKIPEGSWLLTRCDLQSARAGQVSGKDLLVWQRRGVRIFNLQALHAKVFAFSGAAFIGSSNASETSRDRLVEAGVWTKDKSLAKAAWDFVETHCAEEVDEAFLAELAAAYRPPAAYPMHGERDTAKRKVTTAKKQTRTQDEAVMHLLRLYPSTPDEAWGRAAEAAEADGQKRIDSRVRAKVDSFSWKAAPSRFKLGDLVLARLTDRATGKEHVLPWARVVAMRKVRGQDDHAVATASFESWEDMTLAAFKRAVPGLMKDFLGHGGRSRQATHVERAAVLKVWRHRHAQLISGG